MTGPSINGDRAPQTLAFLLSQVGIHASRRFAERIADVDLNPPLFRVLNLVAAAEGQSQQAIAAAIEIPPSRMVALVDELEQRGLVERRPKPEDRRVRALFLTAEGRRLARVSTRASRLDNLRLRFLYFPAGRSLKCPPSRRDGAEAAGGMGMALVRWDPARELDALQGDMNRLFDSFFGRREGASAGAYASRRWIPPMDLVETEDHLVLRADLPGVDEEDIEIEVKDGVLTVSGERRSQHEDKREGFHRVERSFGRFSRSLELPKGVDPQSVSAHFDKGVLEVRMPKPAERKPTRIEINSGEEQPAIEAEEQRSEDRRLVANGAGN
jgi:HSP20 family protein